jgi:hypothetical protein
LHDSNDGPFIEISKLMKLQTGVFIKYWLKSSQKDLADFENKEREKWIRRDFFTENDTELSAIDKQLEKIDNSLHEALAEETVALQKANTSERFKPDEKEFSDPNMKEIFRKAFKQYETVLPFLSTSETKQSQARALVNDAKIKYWRDNDSAKRCFAGTLTFFFDNFSHFFKRLN